MKIVIAPDSFKGTMTSVEFCETAGEAIKEVLPDACVVLIPMADGGEGTVDALLNIFGGEKVCCQVKNPFFEDITAFYGKSKAAVIEMAAASGLLLAKGRENPLITTTFGTGQLIKKALDDGFREIIIGIGGSSTNDGGIGCAAALGAKFLDKDYNEVPLNGYGLGFLEHIDLSNIDKRLSQTQITVICDVKNPLFGKTGASYVYAKQKGADVNTIKILDNNLRRLDNVIKKDIGKDISGLEGSGAAGGLGAGLVTFFNAHLKSGIDTILDALNYEEVIKDADLIITGEGRADKQSIFGKVPYGIAKRSMGKPVVLIAGEITEGAEELYKIGITSMFSTNPCCQTFKKAAKNCRTNLYSTIKNVIKLIF